MPKFPTVSKEKELPLNSTQVKEIPKETELKDQVPQLTRKVETIPEESSLKTVIPNASPEKQEKPSDLLEENCVKVGDKIVEIKPTKLKYFRNKAASGYGIIKAVPLYELLTYDQKGTFDENRNSDQLLYDFLVAAFDDISIVRDHYDDFDAETIERIVKIFGRINHIDEKEEAARKNREAQAQVKH